MTRIQQRRGVLNVIDIQLPGKLKPGQFVSRLQAESSGMQLLP